MYVEVMRNERNTYNNNLELKVKHDTELKLLKVMKMTSTILLPQHMRHNV